MRIGTDGRRIRTLLIRAIIFITGHTFLRTENANANETESVRIGTHQV